MPIDVLGIYEAIGKKVRSIDGKIEVLSID